MVNERIVFVLNLLIIILINCHFICQQFDRGREYWKKNSHFIHSLKLRIFLHSDIFFIAISISIQLSKSLIIYGFPFLKSVTILYTYTYVDYPINIRYIYIYVYSLFGRLFWTTHAWHEQILKAYRLSEMT